MPRWQLLQNQIAVINTKREPLDKTSTVLRL